MSKECSICNTDMFNPDIGKAYVGLEIKLWGDDKETRRVKAMFGTLEFDICWCCWIKSLGIKPI